MCVCEREGGKRACVRWEECVHVCVRERERVGRRYV